MNKITIRITLDGAGLRLLVLALLVLGLSGSVVWAGEETSPAGSTTYVPMLQGSSGRRYYLSQTQHTGKYADEQACASGFHMASMWEILDVSNLTYDTTWGYQPLLYDCGQGAPAGVEGWVRTGEMGNVGPTPGGGNCAGWGFEEAGMFGTVVSLPTDWTGADSVNGVWQADTRDCATAQYVWCVED